MTDTAVSLDHLASSGGITAVFRPGLSGQSHEWKVRGQSGSLLAHTVRCHRGGRFAQAFWRFWNQIGMGVGDDIHVELVGAEGLVLARITSEHDKPAIVTVTDADGVQVARSERLKDVVTLYGRDDQLIVTMRADGDGPWPLTTESDDVLGELLAGTPGPKVAPALWEWVAWPDVALDRAAYAKGMHLGLRKVRQYTFAPSASAGGDRVALALLPLLCGLTY